MVNAKAFNVGLSQASVGALFFFIIPNAAQRTRPGVPLRAISSHQDDPDERQRHADGFHALKLM